MQRHGSPVDTGLSRSADGPVAPAKGPEPAPRRSGHADGTGGARQASCRV